MSDTLKALELEFKDQGLECYYGDGDGDGVSDEILVVESASYACTLALFTQKDGELSAIEYTRDSTGANIDRTDLGFIPLCDPDAFAGFVDMIVQKAKEEYSIV